MLALLLPTLSATAAVEEFVRLRAAGASQSPKVAAVSGPKL